jgi:hypothetical protein
MVIRMYAKATHTKNKSVERIKKSMTGNLAVLQKVIFASSLYKMKIRLIILGFLFGIILTSCQKEVQLAQGSVTVLDEMTDHTPVYLFFVEQNGDTLVELNRKNTVSTTNWIFHVDKRLPLKLVTPKIINLQQMREDNQMHKNEEAGNFYSYSDSLKQSLAFYPFKEIKYTFNTYHSVNYIADYPDFHSHYRVYSLTFLPGDLVVVNGTKVAFKELKEFITEFLSFEADGQRVLLYLNFHQDVTFDAYMKGVLFAFEMQQPGLEVSNTHFVFDPKAVDCECFN